MSRRWPITRRTTDAISRSSITAGSGSTPTRARPGCSRCSSPCWRRNGLVVEIGCGSGLLTRYLIDAGHRVIATDASPAMLDLAHEVAGDAQEIRRLTLPDDPIPAADAIVGVGHALNYLPDAGAIDRALIAIAGALNPGGVLAIDLCDLEWGAVRKDQGSHGWVDDDWALVTEFSLPTPDRYVRQMATFIRDDDGSWHRDDERHDNILIDTSRVPALLAEHGVEATVRTSFGDETLPEGLRAIVGHRIG